MRNKLVMAAVAALVAGIAFGESANAGLNVPYPGPIGVINPYCAAQFTKSGGTFNYKCSMTFFPRCKHGLASNTPKLIKVGSYWRVEYACYEPVP